jgi:hypothetical protein
MSAAVRPAPDLLGEPDVFLEVADCLEEGARRVVEHAGLERQVVEAASRSPLLGSPHQRPGDALPLPPRCGDQAR